MDIKKELDFYNQYDELIEIFGEKIGDFRANFQVMQTLSRLTMADDQASQECLGELKKAVDAFHWDTAEFADKIRNLNLAFDKRNS